MCRMATPQTPWGRKTWILLQRGWDSTRLRSDEPALCPPALSPAPGGWEGPKPQRETGRSKHQPCGKMKQRRKIESREQYRWWGRAVPCGTPRDVSGAPSPCETSLTCPFAAFLGVSPHPRNCFAFGGVFGVFPPGSLEMPQSPRAPARHLRHSRPSRHLNQPSVLCVGMQERAFISTPSLESAPPRIKLCISDLVQTTNLPWLRFAALAKTRMNCRGGL